MPKETQGVTGFSLGDFPCPPFKPEKPESKGETRTIVKIVLPEKGSPIFADNSTRVEIVDEASGEFLEISQVLGTIRIVPEEWEQLKAAIDEMVAMCKTGEDV